MSVARDFFATSLAKLRPYRFSFLAVVGLVLIGFGSYCGYWWFYKLTPQRHLLDQDWKNNRSVKARWAVEQEKYRRANMSPDLCFSGDRIGYYGDKNWLVWLVTQISQDNDFRHCGCTQTALSFMSNQEPADWSDWLKAHRDQTQEQWIQDGFRKYGVEVHLPPQPEDQIPLLRLIGAKTWPTLWNGPQTKPRPDIIPDYIQYNAFRWLRDSGFDPLEYALTNPALVNAEKLDQPLRRYAQWNNLFGLGNDVGILAFSQNPGGPVDYPKPTIIRSGFLAIVYAVIFVPLLAGLSLLVLAFCSRTGARAQAAPVIT